MKKKLRPHDVDVILISNLSFFYLNRSNILLSIYLNLLPITNTFMSVIQSLLPKN